MLTDKSVDYQYFSIHGYNYKQEVYCNICKNGIQVNKRNSTRVMTSPTRNRLYTRLTDNDKESVYFQLGHKRKFLQLKHSQLITKLEGKDKALSFGIDTPARDEMLKSVECIKLHSKESNKKL